MKHNLIKTDNYLLVVDDDSDIKVHGYYLRYSTKVLRCTDMKWVYNDALNKNEIIITSDSSGDPYDRSKHFLKKIISHLPLNGAPYLDGVDVLPPLEDEAEQIFPVGSHGLMHMPNKHQIYNSLRQEGYNKAREKYKFTEEDMRKAIDMYSNSVGVDNDGESCYSHLSTEQIIQSLQQPKYPIAFECEIEPKFKHIGSTKEVKGSGSRIKNKHAGNPKTIISSEGRTEWVGKYIYN
jgi:hypothetical protein